MNKLTNLQLKELIAAHEVKWNLTALNQKSQELVDLTTKLLKSLEAVEAGLEVDQVQLLKDLEQLRITKHHLRGIRFVNFYRVLKGEIPRQTTTEKFEVEKWLKQQAEKEAKWKEKLEKEKTENKN